MFLQQPISKHKWWTIYPGVPQQFIRDTYGIRERKQDVDELIEDLIEIREYKTEWLMNDGTWHSEDALNRSFETLGEDSMKGLTECNIMKRKNKILNECQRRWEKDTVRLGESMFVRLMEMY